MSITIYVNKFLLPLGISSIAGVVRKGWKSEQDKLKLEICRCD